MFGEKNGGRDDEDFRRKIFGHGVPFLQTPYASRLVDTLLLQNLDCNSGMIIVPVSFILAFVAENVRTLV